jgi:hypothetical protein
MAGMCKFVSEFLREWPILFMDDYQAKEWLSERIRIETSTKTTSILCNSKKKDTRLEESLSVKPVLSEKNTQYSDALFDDILGYDDIKALFRRAISSDKQVHILLVGPPACAKSLFTEHLIKLKDSLFTIGSQSTKAGIIDALFERRPKFLEEQFQKQSTEEVEKQI